MKRKRIITIHDYDTPLGKLRLGSIDGKICLSDWADGRYERNILALKRQLDAETAEGDAPILETAIRQLSEYFEGARCTFDLPLLVCGTEFQQSVRQVIGSIPYGSTTTYAALAALAGRPRAVRAAANATASNPLSILIPCHRVTGSGGSLTGYSGGLDRKLRLLRLESSLT